MEKDIKIIGVDCSSEIEDNVNILKIEGLPYIEFHVHNDFKSGWELKKNEDDDWIVECSSEISVSGNNAYCNRSTYDKIKNDKSELEKFKEFLSKNKYDIVYSKECNNENNRI